MTTVQVARMTGLSYDQVFRLLRFGRVRPPQKLASGDYYWRAADVSRVRRAVESRRMERERVRMTCARRGDGQR